MTNDPDLRAWSDDLARAARPDPALRARHLARARAAFEGLHAPPARAPAWRSWRLWPAAGGGLAAAVVAVGALVLTPAGRDLWDRPAPAAVSAEAELAQAPAPDVTARARAAGPVEAPARSTAAAPPQARLAPAPPADVTADSAAGPAAEALAAPTPPPALAAEAAPARPADALAPIRRALEAGALPPPGSVGVEAVLAEALAGLRPDATTVAGPLHAAAWVAPTPWDPATRLVVVTVGAPEVDARGVEARPAWSPETVAGARRVGGSGALLRAKLLPAGGTVAAVWEVTPTEVGEGSTTSLGALGLRSDGAGDASLTLAPTSGAEARLAAAVAGWALLLDGEDLEDWGLADAAVLAAALGPDPSGARAEVLDLMRLSADLAP